MTLQAFFVTNNICYQFFIVEAEFFFHSLNSLSIFEVGREKKRGWGLKEERGSRQYRQESDERAIWYLTAEGNCRKPMKKFSGTKKPHQQNNHGR